MSAAVASLPTALGPVARVAERQRGAAAHQLSVSFEFSPPKTEEAEENLWACIRRLEPLNPSFVSVTYGAGGSTRDRTHRTVKRILEETNLKAAAHLTCVEASRDEVDEVIQGYWDAGIRHIVALRGDPPGAIGGVYSPRADGYANATELTAGISRIGAFEVSVGLYPHIHPESGSLARDIDVLKAKVDAGATRAITQFFFDIDGFLRFVDQVRKAGVTIPILPGIMPVNNFKGLQKMCVPMGVQLPDWLGALFDGLDKDPDTRRLIACSVAAEMCAKLEEEGFSDFHFFTLNRADLVYAICRVLGVREASI
jgi:methylenetetrahydrofolate reductase (NADPH)